MGNPLSVPYSEETPSDTLVHSFRLDATTDFWAFPPCKPGKQAMFHKPKEYPSNLVPFLSDEECARVIEDLNQILSKTGFPNHHINPAILMAVGFSFFSFLLVMFLMWTGGFWTWGGIVMPGIFLPIISYFVVMQIQKSRRQNGIVGYVKEWNEKAMNGVRLALGGSGITRRGMMIGSDTGGSPVHFFLSTYDMSGTFFRGYLHVFVNSKERSTWCSNNGIPFVAPVAVAPPTAAMQVQIPQGYALVPTGAPHVQTPPGYAGVPMGQLDLQIGPSAL